jgi:hypothetical protein
MYFDLGQCQFQTHVGRRAGSVNTSTMGRSPDELREYLAFAIVWHVCNVTNGTDHGIN